MKLLHVMDDRSTAMLYDLTYQRMLMELVASERSVTELSRKLSIPVVTAWKRMQKLLGSGLVEVAEVRRSGNVEAKMYRATAARYVPAQLLAARPRDPVLREAAEIYSQIQGMGLALMAKTPEVPLDADPYDYAVYANLRVFVEVNRLPGYSKKLAELEEKLSRYEPRRSPLT